MAKSPTLVAVYWDDHSGKAPDWADTIRPGGSKIEAMPIVTVGWLVEDNPAGVIVACEQVDGQGEGEFRGSTTILREHVRFVRVLRKSSLWRRPTPSPNRL